MRQMKAKTLFTRNSPTTGQILHGDDRDKADVRARYPLVSDGDAEFLEAEGLADPYDGRVPKEGEGDVTVDERAGQKVEDNVDAENSVERTTGLSTRDTTAHSQAPEAMAGSGGANRDVIKVGSEPDAPAGGGKSASGGKPAKASGSSEGGEKPLSKMNADQLTAEASKMDPPVTTATDSDGNEIPFAEATNKEKAAAIQKARDATAPASA